MKNLFHYIQTSPHRSRLLLGIEYEQLSPLITYLQQLEADYIAQHNARKIRLNAPGAGRPTALSAETEILLCLYYLRHYPTFEILGLTFEVSASQAHAVTHYWVQFLRQALPASLVEESEDCEAAWSVVTELLVDWELIVDSTEQVRQRPNSDSEATLLRQKEANNLQTIGDWLARWQRYCRCHRCADPECASLGRNRGVFRRWT
ncbi:helix-turn-helix domain-containing protein [Leptolyngbya sp. AN03gr2]